MPHVNPKEAAAILRVSVQTVYNLARSGKLRYSLPPKRKTGMTFEFEDVKACVFKLNRANCIPRSGRPKQSSK